MHQAGSSSPHLPFHQMESPVQTYPPSPQIQTQGYGNHNQRQSPAAWNGSPLRQNPQPQNAPSEPYPQQMSRYYQGSYAPHQNASESNQYVNANQNNYHAYNNNNTTQYASSRQAGYPNQSVPHPSKSNYNTQYYPQYANSDSVQQSNYANAPSMCPSKNTQCANPPFNKTQTTSQQNMSYVKQQQQNAQYSRHVGNYTASYSSENQMGYCGKQVAASSSSTSVTPTPPSASASLSQVNSQLSSIPTPPETNGPGDISCGDGISLDGMAECGKIGQMTSSSFVFPGSSTSQVSMSVSSATTTPSGSLESQRVQNWNGNGTVPPPNVDEGSQASSASASSSIPDEQNSMKASSKPNFSYPPTPNTLSSPGAASMSSFHDDLECISSPGWPRTPASPVAPNTNTYEFANIKRPESLLKLYSLSDEPDRRYFLDKLIVFSEDRGSPITQCPTISKQPLDVFRVYLAVKERGGFVEVTNAKRWKDIAGAIGVGASSSAAYTLRKQYMKLLLPFECKYDRGGIDHQPIINQVEASSRKKGKNASPGNSNMCMQGYPQGMENYPSQYPDYPNSRYPYNSGNVDYRYSSHYSQSAQHPQSNQQQQGYSHYPQNEQQQQYGYYQQGGASNYYSNGTDPRYSTTSPSPSNTYYNSNYAMQQNYPSASSNAYKYSNSTNATYSSNSTNVDANPNVSQPIRTVSSPEQNSYEIYPTKSTNSSSNMKANVPCDRVATPKLPENANSCSSPVKTNSGNESSCNIPKPTMQQMPSSPMPKTAMSSNPQPFQGISSNNYQREHPTTCSPAPQIPNAINSPNMGANYDEYQHKAPYGHYVKSSTESYRGSEGPPMYPAQTQVKCSPMNGPPADHMPTYTGQSPMVRPNAYDQNSDGYPPFPNKEQYPMDYPKDPYNNNAKVSKGWGPNYAYQSHNMDPNVFPKKSYPEVQAPFPPPVRDLNKKQPPMNAHYACSPNKMMHQPNASSPHPSFVPTVKKPLEFPKGSVEDVSPLYRKRRRYSAKRVSPVDPWRLMLALKSGLLVESTWALDTLSVLLCDNSSTVYLRLSHLPGLLSILVEHYRRFLNKIFDLFNDLEMKDFQKDKNNASEQRKNSASFNWHKKSKVLDFENFTYKTRCNKKVNILYDEALFLIDPDQKWDIYEGFNIDSNHWLMGRGEITDYVQIPFDNESGKVKFARDMDMEQNDKAEDSSSSVSNKSKSSTFSLKDLGSTHPSLSCFGEPMVVLKKCNVTQKAVKLNSHAECSNVVSDNKSKMPNVESNGDNVHETNLEEKVACEKSVGEVKIEVKTEDAQADTKTNESNSVDDGKGFPRLRCLMPQKRAHAEELEDEAYCSDHPALNLSTDFQDALIRRCLCVSNILRNLSFIPGNDVEMNKNSCLLLVLGRLLLLYHEHKPVKSLPTKYDKECDNSLNTDDSCLSLRNDNDWKWRLLHALRDNTFVILSNITGQLDLTPFPEEISLPILDGLLHWVTCPSSYARDSLPVKPSLSVLTPQRLSLEALCKLSVLDNNVDLMVATPPWSRIEQLFELLVRSLGPVEDKVVKEFSIVLLSSLCEADSSVARTIANQNQCISYLIGFIEQAEANAFQIVSSQGVKKLKENPDMIGTTPNMVLRVAGILKNLAVVPENQCLFFRYQQRLLTLVTSQIIEQELATTLSEVLFYCSMDIVEDASLPNS